jgi:predicted benzoate:H+ symporter BenE
MVRRDQVSLRRLVWVAPLTLALAVAAAFLVRFVAQLVDPHALTMPQLGMPMVVLTIEGAVAAIAVFVVFALFVPRPIRWYRVIGGLALLASLLPDLALALGGAPMLTAMSVVGPLTRIGAPGGGGQGGPPPGGGGPPPGFLSGMSVDQVLVLL